MAERLRISAPVGLLHQQPGQQCSIEWSHAFKDDEEDPSPEAIRCLELHALLTWGHGIWEPMSYHFRLPSGHHSGTFIRIANALVDPRAARVLATWFDPYLAEKTGLIVDSGRLTGLVLAIQERMKLRGWNEGPVEILEDYPITSFDVTNLVRKVSNEADNIVAVISVSSSGSLLSMVASTLDAAVDESRWRGVVMIDRSERVARQVDTWMHYPDAAGARGRGASGCELCSDPGRAFLISVDPKTFDGMLPYQTRVQRPSVKAQRRNKHFWEVAARYCGLEEAADPHVVENRARRSRMSMKVRWDGLVEDPDLVPKLNERLSRLDKINREFFSDHEYRPFVRQADLILCPSHEADMDGHATVVEQVAASLGLGTPRQEAFPVKAADIWPDALQETVQDATAILLVSLGTVTGRTLGRAKRAIQETKKLHPGANYMVQTLVVHARPDNPRDYRDLWNVLDQALYSIWLSYIPDSQSPLQEERELLESLLQSGKELSRDGRKFLEHRVALAQGAGPGAGSVFWGFAPDAGTTPYAISGRLDATGAYLATGTAIHEARLTGPPQVPERQVFDMAGIGRSYFDEVLIAGFLRWIRPHELSWMAGPDSAEDSLQQLLGRTTDEDKRAGLLAELLLAAALGKIPKVDRPYLVAEAEGMLSHSQPGNRWCGALELGLALLDS